VAGGATGYPIPIGTIITYLTASCPAGYLAADGTSYSKTGTYANLYAVIGTTFGGTSSNFSVPDLRGYFVRGYGDSTYTPTFGATQLDAFQGHWHALRDKNSNQIDVNGTWASGSGVLAPNGGVVSNLVTAKEAITDGSNGNPRTAAETRPRNIALQYCIKY